MDREAARPSRKTSSRERAASTQILDLLAQIGIGVRPVAGSAGFVDGLRITAGGIEYNAERARPSDLLHEAGHLAVIPAAYRAQADGDLTSLFEAMGDDAIARFEIDSPEMRAVLQSGEAEAMAWAYAVGKRLGLDDDDIIHPDDYDGHGLVVRGMLSFGAHFGVNGLRHGGMLATVKSYPKLTRWVQA